MINSVVVFLKKRNNNNSFKKKKKLVWRKLDKQITSCTALQDSCWNMFTALVRNTTKYWYVRRQCDHESDSIKVCNVFSFTGDAHKLENRLSMRILTIFRWNNLETVNILTEILFSLFHGTQSWYSWLHEQKCHCLLISIFLKP